MLGNILNIPQPPVIVIQALSGHKSSLCSVQSRNSFLLYIKEQIHDLAKAPLPSRSTKVLQVCCKQGGFVQTPNKITAKQERMNSHEDLELSG